MYAEVMAAMGDRYRGWTHGVVHGILEGIFFVLPVVGVISLYERKSFKYVAINAGYWIVLLAITGAIICGWQ